jgi:exopolysaccharide biosynthesis protein
MNVDLGGFFFNQSHRCIIEHEDLTGVAHKHTESLLLSDSKVSHKKQTSKTKNKNKKKANKQKQNSQSASWSKPLKP